MSRLAGFCEGVHLWIRTGRFVVAAAASLLALPAGVRRRRPGHHRHHRRHRHRFERRRAARHPRHRAQRRHRPDPQRPRRRRRRLPPRVPADRQLRRRGRRSTASRPRTAAASSCASPTPCGSTSSLELGALAEMVTVNAAAPLVNTSTAEIARTIEAAAIAELPLVDRNVYSLLDLTPGVQSNNNGVVGRLDRHQLAGARLPRAAHADQRRRRRRHRLGELLPRWRHQHDRAAQHRQHPAQPGRHPGVQGPDQQLQRGVRPFRQRRHQRGHQVRHQRVSRLALRFPPRRAVQRQGLGFDAGHAAARPQPVRRRRRRAARSRTRLLLRLLLGAAPDHQHLPEQRHRADRARAHRRLQRSRRPSRSIRRPDRPSSATASPASICANRIDPVATKIINNYIPAANVPATSGRATCTARSTPTNSW